MNYGQRFVTLYRRQGSRPSPRGKKMQKGKMVVCRGLTNNCERREAKDKGERERYTQLNTEFQKTAKNNKKAFLNEQCKEIEGKNRMGRLEISS